jgi:hypothetical protein
VHAQPGTALFFSVVLILIPIKKATLSTVITKEEGTEAFSCSS